MKAKPNQVQPLESIVIPVRPQRLRQWLGWTLEAATWGISLGLLACGILGCGAGVLLWLLSGSSDILALGCGGGLLLGLAGVWHLLRRLERTVNRLRQEAAQGV